MAKYMQVFVCLCISTSLHAELETLRDPTQPLPMMPGGGSSVSRASAQQQNSAQIPRLQAIVIQGRKRFAILDGKRYQEGDQIQQYQVDSIAKNEVILAAGSNSISLLFYPNKVRAIKDTVEE